MEQGFLLDRHHGESGRPADWIEGVPVSGFFGVKLKGRKVRPVTTWRCTRCGLLESWAPET